MFIFPFSEIKNIIYTLVGGLINVKLISELKHICSTFSNCQDYRNDK